MADHLDGGEKLRAEDFRPAAIVRERDEGVAGVEIALHGAEVGFHRPEGGDHLAGHAEFLLGAGEDRREVLQLLAADVEAGLADGALGEFEEGLAEDALGAVTREHLLVDRRTGERPVGHLGGNAERLHLGLHAFEEGGKVAAAGGGRLGLRAAGEKESRKARCQCRRKVLPHLVLLDPLSARLSQMNVTEARRKRQAWRASRPCTAKSSALSGKRRRPRRSSSSPSRQRR